MSARVLKERINAIARGEADIIIGTQLVAKGTQFSIADVCGGD